MLETCGLPAIELIAPANMVIMFQIRNLHHPEITARNKSTNITEHNDKAGSNWYRLNRTRKRPFKVIISYFYGRGSLWTSSSN